MKYCQLAMKSLVQGHGMDSASQLSEEPSYPAVKLDVEHQELEDDTVLSAKPPSYGYFDTTDVNMLPSAICVANFICLHSPAPSKSLGDLSHRTSLKPGF